MTAVALWPETEDAAIWPDESLTHAAPAATSDFDAWLRVITPRYRWDWPHLRVMRDRLARVTVGTSDREAFFIPPRHGKTEQNTIRYGAYRLERRPGMRIIIAAYNATLARKFSRRMRTIARDRIALNPERTAVEDWETAQGGGVRAVGVGDGITGQGADLILIDDPVKSREEANSETFRERVWEWFTQDLLSRLEPGGQVLLTMTRWHVDDLAGRILDPEFSGSEAARWGVTLLPALADYDLTGGSDPIGRREGDALCPDRYDRAALMAMREINAEFDALYQQRPTLKSGEMIDPAWFGDPVDAAPATATRVRGWDKAATAGGGDYTAGAKVSRTAGGVFYIEHIARGRWAPGERDQKIRHTATTDGLAVTQMGEQEPGAAGKSDALAFVKLLEGYAARTQPASGDKTVRAGPFASAAQVGNVKVVRGEWNRAFFDELRAFPRGAHDDQVDALSLAFNTLARTSTVAIDRNDWRTAHRT